MKVVSVFYMVMGLDVDVFLKVLFEVVLWVYLMNFVLYNLIGVMMMFQVVYWILSVVMVYDVIIVEDDIFVGFELEFLVWFVMFDGFVCVIWIGSFFKIFLFVMCCGYIVVCFDWIEVLMDL